MTPQVRCRSKYAPKAFLDLAGLLGGVAEWARYRLFPTDSSSHLRTRAPGRSPLDYKNAIRLEQSTHGDEEAIVLTTDSPAERDELYGVLMYGKTTRFLEQQLQKKVQEYERDLPSLM